MLVISLENRAKKICKCFESSSGAIELMCEYEQYLRNESGPMNKFWQQYLDMVEILFDFRKFVRDGNWNLRIAASDRMLKWFMVYDSTNYARHFTYYWAS